MEVSVFVRISLYTSLFSYDPPDMINIYDPKDSLCHQTSRPLDTHLPTALLNSWAIPAGPQTSTATLSSLSCWNIASTITFKFGRVRPLLMTFLFWMAPKAISRSSIGESVVDDNGLCTVPVTKIFNRGSARR